MKDFSYFTESWDDRVSICNKYEKLFEKKYFATNLQNVKTPKFLINKMIDKASSLKDKKILVMFNFEFVDALIHEYNVNPDMIYFVADCHKDMCKVIKLVYNLPINNIIHHKEFKDNSLIDALRKMSMKFDLCITNPPYNNGIDIKILSFVSEICDEIVFINPSPWILLQKKYGYNYKKFDELKNKISKYIDSIEFIESNIFGGDTGTCNPLNITHVKKCKTDAIINVINFIGYFGIENFSVDDLNNITKFGTRYLNLVKNFEDKMKECCKDGNNVHAYIIKKNKETYDSSKFYAQTMFGMAGGDMFANGFHIMLSVDSDKYCRVYENNTKPAFKFNTLSERENFLNYCKTDFVRFCIALLKIDIPLISGEMELIPWLDFSQSWDDEKLFKHFEIDQETQNYIRKFLPDYYGIRKEKSPESIVKNIMQQYYCNEDNTNIFINTEKDVEKPTILKTKISTAEEYMFYFYNEEIKENFEYFLNTKFVKFLKTLVKCNVKNEQRICIIPDMDFSEKWTDEKLMEYFNIPEEIKKYILN